MTRRTPLVRHIAASLRRVVQREDGSATIDFALMVPLMFTVFIMAMEAGIIQLRQVMFDRALDLTIRELRLGHFGETVTQDDVFDRICENSFLIPNCRSNLSLELTPITLAGWAPPATNVECIDRDTEVAPINALSPAGQDRPTLVRACLIVDLMFPTSRYGLNLATDSQGGYRMVSYSFYIAEPQV